MTATPRVFELVFYEGQSPTLLARIVDENNALLLQANVSSIAVSVRDYDTPVTELATDVPVVANVIFDALQTDAIWTEDTEGYNFKYAVPVAKLTESGQFTYMIEVVITTTADVVPAIWKAEQLEVVSV